MFYSCCPKCYCTDSIFTLFLILIFHEHLAQKVKKAYHSKSFNSQLSTSFHSFALNMHKELVSHCVCCSSIDRKVYWVYNFCVPGHYWNACIDYIYHLCHRPKLGIHRLPLRFSQRPRQCLLQVYPLGTGKLCKMFWKNKLIFPPCNFPNMHSLRFLLSVTKLTRGWLRQVRWRWNWQLNFSWILHRR